MSSRYEWLVIVEGSTDVGVFKSYLINNNSTISCHIEHVSGKNMVMNMPTWTPRLLTTLKTALGRVGFKGVILVVDSDDDYCNPFNGYVRGGQVQYIAGEPCPRKDSSGDFWQLDTFIGVDYIPLKGVNMPNIANGGLETELLEAYGFPTKKQSEYSKFTDIVKHATNVWNIPDNNDGSKWWANNETAKMDKFIYLALKEGFSKVATHPQLPPNNPDVITRIQKAMTV